MDFKRATGRQGVDEASLLQQLAEVEQSGLIIHGAGGIGKTRLALELGRRARAEGWIVLLLTKWGEQQKQRLLEVLTGHQVLLILDYVETLDRFDDLLEELDDLAAVSATRLRYVATCRGFFFQQMHGNRNHRLHLNCNPEDQHQAYWMAYRRAVVFFIQNSLEQRDSPELFDESPVVAVFLADPTHRAKLSQLTDVQGSKILRSTAWLDRQLARWSTAMAQQTNSSCTRAQALECLALIYATLPLAQASFEAEADALTRIALTQLRGDGWLELSDDPETRVYQGPHDFVADMILAAYLIEAPAGEARRGRLDRLLAQADRWQAHGNQA